MPRRTHPTRRQRPPTPLILAGIALILVAVFAFKSSNNTPTSAASFEINRIKPNARLKR